MKNYVITWSPFVSFRQTPDSHPGDATALALTLLIRNSLKNRQWALKHPEHLNINDLMTVKLSGGRRTGHTTAGVKVAKEMFDKPVFMWGNQRQANMFAKEFGLDPSACGTYNSLGYLIGRDFDCVFMDEPSHAEPGRLEQAVAACQACALKFPDRFTIIQVG